ncbi:MAG: universal stress protein, partial [Haloarcula sp.]
MSKPILSHLLVPVASERDAAKTARALRPYDPDAVTIVHVVEKGEGMPQDAPVEQPRSVSAAAVRAFRQQFPDANSRTVLHGNVVESVVETAIKIDASAIAF